jgi:hypothetical protein
MSNIHYVKVEDVEEWAEICIKFQNERDEWRKCAERLAAIVGVNENEFHIANDIDLALEEFNQLKNKYE